MGRTMAVVLFTDLVGSTELRGQLGEEAADELRRTHDQLLARAVEANNGRVVKGLGDGIMATFAGAADAVAAAVAIQQGIDRLNRSGKAAVPLAVRVGLSAGDVNFEDEDVHGTPVIEASRLCAAAGGDEILASEMVRWLARADASERFTPMGSVELKGLADPVSAVRVDWEPAVVSTIPVPALLTDVGRIFVGRDAEVERLTQLWKEAAAGERRIALVSGEPGVGKTRLAAELACRIYEEGGVVVAGRCDEDLGVPYQPFVEALRHFVDHTTSTDLPGRLGRYGGELARLLPELADRDVALPRPLRSDPETERYRLFDAVAGWLAVASGDDPIMLVLDDLQWAAKPTLLLLRHIVRSAVGRILILCTYRDTELVHDHPLVDVVGDLRRQGGVERVSLSGLDDMGVRAFVEQAAGRSLDEAGVALAMAVYEETEGNPFFVREVLRHLAETGAVERREGGWHTRLSVEELGIPEGVKEVVGRRLARLSPGTHHALRVAAVVGPVFELGVIGTAGDLDEDAVLCAVEEAAEARLITEVSATRFRFAHALVQATLYESLTAARRITHHRKVAEAIETIHEGALDDFVPALAHHWTKASAPVTDTTRAVDYVKRAGDRALGQLAHDEAASYYASGLELLDAGGADPADPRRLELLLGRGEAQRLAGDPGYRDTLLDAARLARQLGDAKALARAALANTLGYVWSGAFTVDAARIEALEAAIAAVGEDDLQLRARLLATLGLELGWDPDPKRRLALSAEALRTARSLGDPQTLAHVLLARDYTISAPDNATQRLAATTEVLRIAEQVGDPVLASRALGLRFKAAMELADITEAERALARNQELVPDLGQPALTWGTLHHQATLRVLRATDAEEAITAAHEFGTTIDQPEIFSWARRTHRLLDQDRAGELEAWARTLAEGSGSPLVKAYYARVLFETNRVEAAGALFDEIAATGFAHPTNNVAWLVFFTECAYLCALLDRDDGVARIRSTLEPYADQLVVGAFAGWVSGSVAFYLGLLCTTTSDWQAGAHYFAAAVATHERIGAPAWLARTRLEWAGMLLACRQRGDVGRARELLDQALESARELGLANVERRAVALLQECP